MIKYYLNSVLRLFSSNIFINYTLKWIILISLFTNLFAASPPSWWNSLKHGSNEIIGYGLGATEDEAAINAKFTIATSIQSFISCTAESNLYESGDTLNKKYESNIKVYTDVILSGTLILKSEKIRKKWYVAVKYDNTPPERKLINSLHAYECKNERQNRYLSLTPVIQDINSKLGCVFDINFTRKNGLWCFSYENINVPLTDETLRKMFIAHSCPDLTIEPSSTSLKEKEIFSIKITSIKRGYISLICVYQNGEAFILEQNFKFNEKETFVFPNPSSKYEMVAGVLKKNIPAYDLWIAIYSQNPLALGRFHKISDKVLKDEWHYKFDEILEILDQYVFSSTIIWIEPYVSARK